MKVTIYWIVHSLSVFQRTPKQKESEASAKHVGVGQGGKRGEPHEK